MTLSHYHQHLREIQGGQPAPSGALQRHQARVSRLAAHQAEDQARRVVKAVIDACLADWRAALDQEACAEWLGGCAALTDAEGKTLSDEALAVQWLEFLRPIERAEPM
jgi:hypothetical protein